jgi:predicted transcriptional regulator
MPNIHMPLTNDLHQRLRNQAAYANKTSTTMAREAMDIGLKLLERQREDEELDKWIAENAGGPLDLDTDAEAASLDALEEAIEPWEGEI